MKDTPPRAAFFRDFLFFRLESRRKLRKHGGRSASIIITTPSRPKGSRKSEKNVGWQGRGKTFDTRLSLSTFTRRYSTSYPAHGDNVNKPPGATSTIRSTGRLGTICPTLHAVVAGLDETTGSSGCRRPGPGSVNETAARATAISATKGRLPSRMAAPVDHQPM